jgi:hypothetical protein
LSSTPADVRSAWSTLVWGNADALALTPNILDYNVLDVMKDDQSAGQTVLARLYDPPGTISFFMYLVSFAEELRICSQIRYTFVVSVSRFLSVDVDGANYNAAIDDLWTVDGIVRDQLGQTWNGTVNFYQTQSKPLEPKTIVLDGKTVWQGTLLYQGIQEA